MPNTKSPIKVFLCHATSDKPKVRELYHFLKQSGIQPWLDEEDILPGQNRQLETDKAIEESNIILICLSRSSVSKEGVVHRDMKFALDQALKMPEDRIFIIPARLDECELPYSLRKYDYADLFNTGGYERLLKALEASGTRAKTTKTEPADEKPSSGVQPEVFNPYTEIGGNAKENVVISGNQNILHIEQSQSDLSRPVINLRPIKTDIKNPASEEEINCIINPPGLGSPALVVFADALNQNQTTPTFLYSFSLKNIGRDAAINLIPTLITPKGKFYNGRILASLSTNEIVILHFLVNLPRVYLWTISGSYTLSIAYSGLHQAYEQTYHIKIGYSSHEDIRGFELDLHGNTIHLE